ncbi:MAG: PDZ domain-containing protein [Anaeroplasmataceae bacterium]|nr:PDZ domain-containing protein [Anaeroplasmataceae bacterium]
MKKIIVFILTLCSLFGVWSASAYELDKDDKIYVGGQSIGIKLNTGVEIIGSYGIYVDGTLYKPWEEAGIKEGDRIISLNNNEVKVTKDLLRALTKSNGKKSTLEYVRNNKVYQTEIKPIFTDDSYSLGLYVKDSILGVGTLTYYIEEINAYGSLGHAITDKDYYSGQIYEAKVTDIIKPTQTEAGEKRATIDSKVIGTVEKNGNTGVLGKTNSSFNSSGMEALGFKTRDEVRLGDAEIWTCIQGKKVEKFKIRITGLAKQKKKSVKGITFEVVDEELLSKTGGIIQGMSGSPIVQDDKIVGAVTHVLVNNSKKGYGIYLEFMLEDMDVTIAK